MSPWRIRSRNDWRASPDPDPDPDPDYDSPGRRERRRATDASCLACVAVVRPRACSVTVAAPTDDLRGSSTVADRFRPRRAVTSDSHPATVPVLAEGQEHHHTDLSCVESFPQRWSRRAVSVQRLRARRWMDPSAGRGRVARSQRYERSNRAREGKWPRVGLAIESLRPSASPMVVRLSTRRTHRRHQRRPSRRHRTSTS